MTETTGTEAEVALAGLRDIHLPPASTLAIVGDHLTVIGLAAACAALILLTMRALFGLRRRARRPSPRRLRDRAMALPPTQRRVALLRLLRDVAPARFGALSSDLYRPDAVSDEDVIAEVNRRV